MNNDYTNPSTISSNTWSSAGQSTNQSQTNNTQPTSAATSFNNYPVNTKWGSHNSSQSSTPTNPSTLTATFPSCMFKIFYTLITSNCNDNHICFMRFCDLMPLNLSSKR